MKISASKSFLYEQNKEILFCIDGLKHDSNFYQPMVLFGVQEIELAEFKKNMLKVLKNLKIKKVKNEKHRQKDIKKSTVKSIR